MWSAFMNTCVYCTSRTADMADMFKCLKAVGELKHLHAVYNTTVNSPISTTSHK